MTLDEQPLGITACVRGIDAPADRYTWARLLADMGFAAGERVCVLRRGALGGDPLVVRVGSSTYALRRAEAACVHVEHWQ
jgi:ferrous iron transport protein A